VTWKVDREIAVLATSGARALLLQVAHPSVAAAVAEHSRYRSDPVGRLRNTLDAIYTFAFDDTERATQIVRRVTRLHERVSGNDASGQAYSALDPHLLLWVYATLIDSSLLAYETFVAPLSDLERDTYYAEFCRAGQIWGIPAADFPPDMHALRAWMAALIASGEVRVSEQGRQVGRDILAPPLWWLPRPFALPLQVVTTWLLPPALRDGFGFPWGPRREALMRRAASVSRRVVPRLPQALRDLPIARAAERRVGRAYR
jgi:uncharacterized protein (DUF2236 family)